MAGGLKAAGAAALLCVLSVTGCTAQASTPSPTPAPPPAATPVETARERQERLDYAAAEKAYRTFRAEYGRVLRGGGAEKPTPLMKQTAGDEYLATFMEVARGFERLGSRETGREKVVYVRHGGYSRDSIRLDVCEDSTATRTIRANGKAGKGELRTASIEVRRVGGVWKVWSGEGKLVTSCD